MGNDSTGHLTGREVALNWRPQAHARVAPCGSQSFSWASSSLCRCTAVQAAARRRISCARLGNTWKRLKKKTPTAPVTISNEKSFTLDTVEEHAGSQHSSASFQEPEPTPKKRSKRRTPKMAEDTAVDKPKLLPNAILKLSQSGSSRGEDEDKVLWELGDRSQGQPSTGSQHSEQEHPQPSSTAVRGGPVHTLLGRGAGARTKNDPQADGPLRLDPRPQALWRRQQLTNALYRPALHSPH